MYRLIRPSRVEKDWQSWKERGINPEVDDCIRSALSCLVTLQDARDFRQALPRFSEATIVHGVLKPEHGRMAQTGGPEHYSLWLRAGFYAIRQTLFTDVSE